MMERFEVINTSLEDAYVVVKKPISDDRGFLERIYCAQYFAGFVPDHQIQQINRTLTKLKGTIRGMHYQSGESSEIKFVSCTRGEVYDVIIDLRKGSKTFMQWHGEILSEGNNKMMIVPKGFAHGFQTLTNNCEMLYLHSELYNGVVEGGVRYDDPLLSLKWPLPISNVSERDKTHPLISNTFKGIEI